MLINYDEYTGLVVEEFYAPHGSTIEMFETMKRRLNFNPLALRARRCVFITPIVRFQFDESDPETESDIAMACDKWRAIAEARYGRTAQTFACSEQEIFRGVNVDEHTLMRRLLFIGDRRYDGKPIPEEHWLDQEGNPKCG